ncbi:MAG: helix-turn-helix domain-containing protein [Clostridia bacterium]|nr:helix-turn-helix domain-containing protein [Clostridia bacterium]
MDKLFNTDAIKKYINLNRITITEFCELCEISRVTYYNIMKGKDIRFASISKIVEIVGLSFLNV